VEGFRSKQIAEIKGDGRCAESVAACERELTFAQSEVDYFKATQKTFETNHAKFSRGKSAPLRPMPANTKTLIEKQMALTNARRAATRGHACAKRNRDERQQIGGTISRSGTSHKNCGQIKNGSSDEFIG